MWTLLDPLFNRFKDRYLTYKRNNGRQALSFKDWQGHTVKSPDEDVYCLMDRTIWTVSRFMLDGVLFRTKQYTVGKEMVNHNFCIMGESEVTGSDRVTRVTRCYGEIKEVYLHFQYPPMTHQLESATEKGRINPSKVGVPFGVFISCRWFEKIGQNPVNTLDMIVPVEEWNSLDLIPLRDCLPISCMFWPSNPFDLDEFELEVEDEYTKELTKYDVVYH
jgi:hypothetical protein